MLLLSQTSSTLLKPNTAEPHCQGGWSATIEGQRSQQAAVQPKPSFSTKGLSLLEPEH
jgi:hypothetical protein